MTKIPRSAFEDYYALGKERSYETLARQYGCSKRAIVLRAKQENWQGRLQDREIRTREAISNRVEESIEALKARHLRMLKAIQGKALEALKALPLTSAMDAVRALGLSIKQERLIYGEATERTAVDLESIIKREYESWLDADEAT